MSARRRGKSIESGWICAVRHHIIAVMNTAATSVHHHVFDTAIGPCGVAWNERGLVGVQLPEADRAATERRLAAAGSAALPSRRRGWRR